MPAQCSQGEHDLGNSGGRKLVGAFDDGAITSNGGVVLLGAADRAIGLSRRLAACFTDAPMPSATRLPICCASEWHCRFYLCQHTNVTWPRTRNQPEPDTARAGSVRGKSGKNAESGERCTARARHAVAGLSLRRQHGN
jgi:hypothetical protein